MRTYKRKNGLRFAVETDDKVAGEYRTLLVELAPKNAKAGAIEEACTLLLKARKEYRCTFTIADGEMRKVADGYIREKEPTMKLKPGLGDARKSLSNLGRKLQKALASESARTPAKVKKLADSLHLSLTALAAFRRCYGPLGKLRRALLVATYIESTLRDAIAGVEAALNSLEAEKNRDPDLHVAILGRECFLVLRMLGIQPFRSLVPSEDDGDFSKHQFARLVQLMLRSSGVSDKDVAAIMRRGALLAHISSVPILDKYVPADFPLAKKMG